MSVMSPRPAASRSDATAILFLEAAAELIDASLSPSQEVPPRLRQIRFPAALDWLRIEDVLRLVKGQPGGSRQALHQRWDHRDAFIQDAIVYAAQFRDADPVPREQVLARLDDVADQPLGHGIATYAKEFLAFVERTPRSFLLSHLAGLLDRHPDLHEACLDAWLEGRGPFTEAFRSLLGRLDVTLRPEWTITRFDRALVALVDGFVLQGRLWPDNRVGDAWGYADCFAESVVALTLGALDVDRTSQTAREALSRQVGPRAS